MLLGVFITRVYSLRLVFLLLFSLNSSSRLSFVALKEEKSLVLPYLLLTVGAVFGGAILAGKINFLHLFSSRRRFEVISLTITVLLRL